MYAGVLVVTKVAVVALVAFYAGPARLSDVTPGNIIKQTNIARSANNLTTLKTNMLLNKAAQAKASDMIRQQYFAHISPSKVTPWAFFKQAGYSYRYAGENLAIDFAESEEIIQAWLASPSHRRNLLSSRYTEIGVAVASGKINGVQSLLVVQMFGAPIKPVVKKTAAAPQTPSPQVVRDQLAQAPKPVVLGQAQDQPSTPEPTPTPTPSPTPAPVPVLVPVTVPPVPPSVPSVDTPADQSVVRTTKPEIVGSAQPGGTVTLFIDGQVNATATVNVAGIYTIVPSPEIPQGSHTVTVMVSHKGLVSDQSLARRVLIDTVPPTIDEGQTYALFSILAPDTFDVRVATSPDATGVNCSCGGIVTTLRQEGSEFEGQLRLLKQTSSAGILSLAVNDMAGNQVVTPLIDPELFTTGAVEPTTGPLVTALNLIFFSRAFMIAFMAAMFLLATINIIVRWERQHRPTIVGSLMLIYLAGSLLFI